MTCRKQTRRWTTRDGTKIRICDMADSHLLNTIRMVRYGAEIRRAANHGLRLLESLAGDPDDAMAEAARLWEEDWYDYLRDPDMYDALFADAERRYLTTLEPKSCHLDFVALAAKARAL